MLDYLIVVCSIVSFLFVLFNSDALPEYLRLFKLNKLFPIIDQYFAQLKNSSLFYSSFPEFISSKYWDYFVIRLLMCQICAGFWLSLILSYIFLKWWLFPVVYMGTMFLYFVLNSLSKK